MLTFSILVAVCVAVVGLLAKIYQTLIIISSGLLSSYEREDIEPTVEVEGLQTLPHYLPIVPGEKMEERGLRERNVLGPTM